MLAWYKERIREFKRVWNYTPVVPDRWNSLDSSYTDLQIALQFLPELKEIVLVSDRYEYIPYIRRSLFKLAGEPSRVVGKEVYYGRYKISIVSLSAGEDKLRGLRSERIFKIETY